MLTSQSEERGARRRQNKAHNIKAKSEHNQNKIISACEAMQLVRKLFWLRS